MIDTATAVFIHSDDGNTYLVQGDGVAGVLSSDIIMTLAGIDSISAIVISDSTSSNLMIA